MPSRAAMSLTRANAPAGFSYLPEFLTHGEQTALLYHLQGLDYKRDIVRGQRLKRAAAMFGYDYVAAGRKLDPAPPLPPFLTSLIAKGMPNCPDDVQFDQCIVTHYPEGAGIGWHTDHPRFGDCIMAVSLGADARLQFRRSGDKQVCVEVLAAPGSLYVMHGPARWDFQHQIVPVKADRFSLTFRHVPQQKADGHGSS